MIFTLLYGSFTQHLLKSAHPMARIQLARQVKPGQRIIGTIPSYPPIVSHKCRKFKHFKHFNHHKMSTLNDPLQSGFQASWRHKTHHNFYFCHVIVRHIYFFMQTMCLSLSAGRSDRSSPNPCKLHGREETSQESRLDENCLSKTYWWFVSEVLCLSFELSSGAVLVFQLTFQSAMTDYIHNVRLAWSLKHILLKNHGRKNDILLVGCSVSRLVSGASCSPNLQVLRNEQMGARVPRGPWMAALHEESWPCSSSNALQPEDHQTTSFIGFCFRNIAIWICILYLLHPVTFNYLFFFIFIYIYIYYVYAFFLSAGRHAFSC